MEGNGHLSVQDRKNLLLGVIGIGLGLLMVIAYIETLVVFNDIFCSKDFLESLNNPEKFMANFKLAMGIVYIISGIPSIFFGLKGLFRRSNYLPGNIASILAIVIGIVLILVVSLTAFK